MTDAPDAIASLVERAVADRVEAAVQAAVEKAVAETAERLQVNYDTATEHLLMTVNDPTKLDGAALQGDSGEGFVYGFIAVDAIDYNRLTKREEADLAADAADLQPLVEDVAARGGIIRPLLVYRNKKEPGRYVLVKGHRRLAALKALGEELVQAYVMPAKPPLAMEEEWVNGF